MQLQAYRQQYGFNGIYLLPVNLYGPGDNFDPNNAMVIPSLIKRAVDGENPLTVWGDGSPIRNFIYAKDVARGMMLAVEKGVNEPINLGSATGVTIKEIAELIAANAPGGPVEIAWDTNKPKGDARRVMDIAQAKELLAFTPRTSIQQGIRETIEWYTTERDTADKRYNVFREEN